MPAASASNANANASDAAQHDTAPKPRYVLRVTCADQSGLIAAVSESVARAGGNILDLAQHTALDIDTFLLKATFETGATFDPDAFRASFAAGCAQKYAMTWELHDLHARRQVALFVSKTDHCLYELLLKHKDGELECDLPCIIANHPDLGSVAGSFGIPFYLVPSDIPKPEQEERFAQILGRYKVDTVVMARYMQILRKEFTELWPNKIINIHHGFLPAFKGAKPYHQAWAKGVKLIGATAHFANEDLDQGPIITQDVEKVDERSNISDLVRLGKDVERRVLLRAIKLHLSHSIFVIGGRTFIME